MLDINYMHDEVSKSNGKAEWIEKKEGVGGNGYVTKGDSCKRRGLMGQETGAC